MNKQNWLQLNKKGVYSIYFEIADAIAAAVAKRKPIKLVQDATLKALYMISISDRLLPSFVAIQLAKPDSINSSQSFLTGLW